MIEGHIDRVAPGGVAQGWARDTQDHGPCQVQLCLDGEVLAHGFATEFRRDLLQAGIGHGHFAFHARLRRALPPGICDFELRLPRTGKAMICAPNTRVEIPQIAFPHPIPVESLLQTPARWTAEDLADHVHCVPLAQNYARMGVARFVDLVFHYVLDRWPDAEEGRAHIAALQAGRIDPAGFLVRLLRSPERAEHDPGLASPFDPLFPFVLG